TADYGALVFKWKNPADKDLYYVDIAFVDPNGNPRSVKTSSYADSTTIQGFSDNKEITFNITAHDKDGNASTSYVVKAAPKLPAFKVMLDQITMTPDFGGAQIEWDNTTNKPFNVNIKYKGNDGSWQNSFFSSVNGANKFYISGLDNNKRDFIVTTSDDQNNTSAPKTISLTPLEESKISKADWSIVDFDTQEPAEGAPNGLATAIIDDNLSTFWHSQWAAANPPYPHYVTIDMKNPVKVSRIVLYNRLNKTSGQTKIQLLGSIDGTTWIDFGTYPFKQINDGQSFRITSNPTVRYIKFVALEGPEFFAFLAELDVWGQN
ncbi:MAG: DUF4959 domain-containing protein, partial [Bacteroidota bacterium]|nr:DUF4959 domain-containing protein [Bacteroidota bacterium]